MKPTGFTMVEILVAMVILVSIVAFTVPNYERTKRRANDEAINGQLRMLADANKLYLSRNDAFFPGNINDVASINTGLNLNLILPANTTFTYRRLSNLNYTADITYSGSPPAFTLRISPANPVPVCVNPPNCPSTP